jgi:hypothetical protein
MAPRHSTRFGERVTTSKGADDAMMQKAANTVVAMPDRGT